MVTFGEWLRLRADLVKDAVKEGKISVAEGERAALDAALGEYSGPIKYLDGTEESALCIWIVRDIFGVESSRGIVVRQPLETLVKKGRSE